MLKTGRDDAGLVRGRASGVALAIALLALAAGSAIAAPPGFSLQVSPRGGTVSQGGAIQATLYVNSTQGPVTVTLNASTDDATVHVSLSQTSGTAIPGMGATAIATITTANATPVGLHVITFTAQQTDALGAPQNDPAYVTYALNVTRPPTPARAPVLSPGVLNVTALPDGTPQRATLQVENPDDAPRTYNASFAATPPGWTLATNSTITVGANGTSSLLILASAGASAQNATTTLVVSVGNASASVVLDLRVAEAPAAPPPDSPAPSSDPPADPVGPATNSTAGPPPPSSSRAADPPASRPSGGVALAVDPATWSVEPGGRASGDIVVANEGDAPVTLALGVSVPGGVSDDLLASLRVIPVHGVARVPFSIHLVGRFEPGDAFDAYATASLAGVAPAPFHVTVTAPRDVADASVRSAPASQGTPALALALWGGATVAGAGVALASTRRRWMVAAALLYTRLAPSRLAEHPRRARILEHLRAAPGASLAELQRALGLANGVLMHHLEVLEKNRVVVSVAAGKERRVFLAGNASRPTAPEPPIAERVVALLVARGRMTQTLAARELGVSRQALHYHVKRLAAEGKLVARVEGRDLVLEPPPRPS